MRIHVAARKAVATAALSAGTVAGVAAIAVGSAAAVGAQPVAEHEPAGFDICQVIGGVPVLQSIGDCQKKAGPTSVPTIAVPTIAVPTITVPVKR
jgi:hypothetical protein